MSGVCVRVRMRVGVGVGVGVRAIRDSGGRKEERGSSTHLTTARTSARDGYHVTVFAAIADRTGRPVAKGQKEGAGQK